MSCLFEWLDLWNREESSFNPYSVAFERFMNVTAKGKKARAFSLLLTSMLSLLSQEEMVIAFYLSPLLNDPRVSMAFVKDKT